MRTYEFLRLVSGVTHERYSEELSRCPSKGHEEEANEDIIITVWFDELAFANHGSEEVNCIWKWKNVMRSLGCRSLLLTQYALQNDCVLHCWSEVEGVSLLGCVSVQDRAGEEEYQA
jgi:hypothetical protein